MYWLIFLEIPLHLINTTIASVTRKSGGLLKPTRLHGFPVYMTSRASVTPGLFSAAPIRLRRRDNRGVPIHVAANWINPVRTHAIHWMYSLDLTEIA